MINSQDSPYRLSQVSDPGLALDASYIRIPFPFHSDGLRSNMPQTLENPDRRSIPRRVRPYRGEIMPTIS